MTEYNSLLVLASHVKPWLTTYITSNICKHTRLQHICVKYFTKLYDKKGYKIVWLGCTISDTNYVDDATIFNQLIGENFKKSHIQLFHRKNAIEASYMQSEVRERRREPSNESARGKRRGWLSTQHAILHRRDAAGISSLSQLLFSARRAAWNSRHKF